MNRRIRLTGVAGVALLLSGVAWAQEARAPKLALSQESWDFGAMWHGENPQLTLVLKNEGNADLNLTRVKAC